MRTHLGAVILNVFMLSFAISCSNQEPERVASTDTSNKVTENVAKPQPDDNYGAPWNELFDILYGDYTLNGQSNIGAMMGDANFILRKGRLGVIYTAVGQQISENGVYKDLAFYEDQQNPGYNRIEGVWDNNDAGDGYFIIKLLKVGQNTKVLLNLEGQAGSGWRYYAERELQLDKYNRLLELLKNPTSNDSHDNDEMSGEDSNVSEVQ